MFDETGPFSSPHRPDGAVVRRRWQLEGSGVVEWFARSSLTVALDTRSVATPRAIIDEITSSDFIARRIWHTSLTAARRTPPETIRNPASTAVLLALQVEGETRIESTRGHVALHAHDTYVCPQDGLLTVSSPAATARIEIVTRSLPLPPHLPALHLARNQNSPASAALIATVNALMNEPEPPSARASEFLVRAMNSLVEALLVERSPAIEASGPRSLDTLYRDAQAFIETSAHNPTVTVASVAEAMGVSVQYLRRAFAAAQKTPSAELRRRRLRIAATLRIAGVDDPDDIARHAGFASAAAMRRARSTGNRRSESDDTV